MHTICEPIRDEMRRKRSAPRGRRISKRLGRAPDAASLVAGLLPREEEPLALDARTRILAGLAALTAVKAAPAQLKAHIQAALESGATRDDVLHTIVEAALYAGFLAASEALTVAVETFAELDRKVAERP
jgi:alkylhydroperoxidase/carboxymuconolactone decarboxylase family protein YurZ